jgi:quercetin dioxygenase-like cupin family protein
MAKKKTADTFGRKLAMLREAEGLTVEELAEMVCMKPAYLKRLEHDELFPPVAEIITIARSLAVEPTAFMSGETTRVTGGKQREALDKRSSDYAYQVLTPDAHDKHLMAFLVTIDPKSEHRKVGYKHVGEEFVYALSGQVKISVGHKTTRLSPGETLHFDSGQRHTLENPGREPALLLIVIYTP